MKLSNFLKNNYIFPIILIISIKVFLWVFVYTVANFIPLSPVKYFVGFHHLGTEPRLEGKGIDFFSLWIYGDSEWYLSIAQYGYPAKDNFDGRGKIEPPYKFSSDNPLASYYKFTEWDARMKYAFFPLYPLSIRFFNLFLPLRVAAFTATNIISMLAFYMFYQLIMLYYNDKRLTVTSLLLLIFYPFSAFYQAYYTEGLFLLLSVCCFYFLKKNQILLSVISGFLLCMTKAIGMFIIIPLIVFMIKQNRDEFNKNNKGMKKKTSNYYINYKKMLPLFFIPLGFIPYAVLNYVKTGYWNYFSLVQSLWGNSTISFIQNFINNVFITGLNFLQLKFLYFHYSKVDYIIMLIFLLLIILSYKRLPFELWLFGFIMWILPVISKDLMSFSRYMSVLFPVFIYLGLILTHRKILYFLLLNIFFVFSFWVHGCIINWCWVG